MTAFHAVSAALVVLVVAPLLSGSLGRS